MLIPSIPPIGVVALATLSAFSYAYDITHLKKPKGPLGVTLDYSFATAWPPNVTDGSKSNVARNWVFSSHLTFKDKVENIKDEQLWKLARDAVDEMVEDRKQYDISKRKEPNAMSVLAWGYELILSSSQRGVPSFTYKYTNTPVLESLRICQILYRDNGPTGSDIEHRTDGKCAEPMAAQLYYSTTEDPLQNQNARIATWVRNNKGIWEKTDPCGDPQRDEWGCSLFVANQKLTVVNADLNPEDYDLKDLAGGISTRDQIQLCSVLRRGGTS